LHGLLSNINKISGKKDIQTPTPWPPVGHILGLFYVFFENIRRRSVRVLKLHREILTSQQIRRPPLAPWGSVFRFLYFMLLLKISKVS
jgi:hypothetical protein